MLHSSGGPFATTWTSVPLSGNGDLLSSPKWATGGFSRLLNAQAHEKPVLDHGASHRPGTIANSHPGCSQGPPVTEAGRDIHYEGCDNYEIRGQSRSGLFVGSKDLAYRLNAEDI